MIPDVLACGGAISISIGAFLICVPLGFTVLGCLLIAAAIIYSKAEGDKK